MKRIFSDQQFSFLIRIMEWLEKWGYVTVGISFLVLGMFVFGLGWYSFFGSFNTGGLGASLELMNDLLLVIILLELFRTILNFLKTHTVTLEPFLYVGIVAAIRKILTTGAQEAVLGGVSDEHFNRYVVDIGLHGLLIVALVIAMFTYRKYLTQKP